MVKVVTLDIALEKLQSEMTVMIGGFMGVGVPNTLINGIIERQIYGLTIISNDTSFPGEGVGKLIRERRIKKLLASHVGTNPETGKLMESGELDVKLIPQGTLIECIRAGGAGLGGVLTPTGVGTIVQNDKQLIKVNGVPYLLELPIKADIALVKAKKADQMGNLIFNRSARNFNPIIATAANFVIAEAEEIVNTGELDPDEIMTPGLFIDYIVKG